MLLRPRPFDGLEAMAEFMRHRHPDRLTEALRRARRLPRIPTRPGDDGGFGDFMAGPEGSAWAAQFWARLLDRPDLA